MISIISFVVGILECWSNSWLTDFFDAASRRHNDVILLPAIRWVSGNDFVFQQDSATHTTPRMCNSWTAASRNAKLSCVQPIASKLPRSGCSAYTISEKAIRFRHPDYNPDRAQKLICSFMYPHLSTRNISSKSMHAFLSNLAHRQTDKGTRARGR